MVEFYSQGYNFTIYESISIEKILEILSTKAISSEFSLSTVIPIIIGGIIAALTAAFFGAVLLFIWHFRRNQKKNIRAQEQNLARINEYQGRTKKEKGLAKGKSLVETYNYAFEKLCWTAIGNIEHGKYTLIIVMQSTLSISKMLANK